LFEPTYVVQQGVVVNECSRKVNVIAQRIPRNFAIMDTRNAIAEQKNDGKCKREVARFCEFERNWVCHMHC
jgi:hypothetical protein